MREFCISVLLLFCFTVFAYANEAEVNTDELKAEIATYIQDCGYKDDGFSDAVVDVCYGEYEQDPWLWTMIAYYESRWNHKVNGDAGEHGWIQLSPDHNHRFIKNGYSWNEPRDLLRVGCQMVRERLDEGKSFYRAFSPWSVRSRAWARYERKFGKAPQKHGKYPNLS